MEAVLNVIQSLVLFVERVDVIMADCIYTLLAVVSVKGCGRGIDGDVRCGDVRVECDEKESESGRRRK
jgi:hypothetical protein